MSEQTITVLLVEDNPGDVRLIREMLAEVRSVAVTLECAGRLAAGLGRLAEGHIDVTLLDLSLPDSQGLETFVRVHAEAPGVPVVVLTGLADERLATEAVQAGAQDYLVKGLVDGHALLRALRYAIERHRAEQTLRELIREQAARAEAEAQQRRFAFLSEASRLLGASLDYETTLVSLARLVVPTLADACTVTVVDEDGSIRPLAVVHADPAKEALTRELQPYLLDSTLPHGVPQVLRTGEPELEPETPCPLLSGGASLAPNWRCDRWPAHQASCPLAAAVIADAEYLERVQTLGVTSSIVVPLVARGRVLGALSLMAGESSRRYGSADLVLAEELGRRAALALDNARLYRDAQDALRQRDEFLATVSHDLRNPLVVIKGWAQLLQRLSDRRSLSSQEQLSRGLATIESAAAKMAALIGELLDLARLQSGRPLELTCRPTDVVDLARQAVADHAQATEGHHFHFAPIVPALVGVWDAARLQRVLDNLLSNAVKYSPEGGEVRVTVARDEDPAGAWAALTVEDEGVGIPESDLPHIFERFHRAGNVVGQITGTGLGLAGARQIVEGHGGTITVVSQEGRGSAFTVRLPLARSGEASPAFPAAPVGARNGAEQPATR